MEAALNAASRDPWAPGPAYIWTCPRCGLRLHAGDTVELDYLKRDHADFHLERGEDPW